MHIPSEFLFAPSQFVFVWQKEGVQVFKLQPLVVKPPEDDKVASVHITHGHPGAVSLQPAQGGLVPGGGTH